MNIPSALEVSARAFRLLKWLEIALKKGSISVESARIYISDPATAKKWIIDHYENFPSDAKPQSLEAIHLSPFVHVFSSYGQTSFRIKEHPGMRYVPIHIRGSGEDEVENDFIVPVRLGRKDKELPFFHKKKAFHKLIEKPKPDLLAHVLADKDLDEALSIYTYCELLLDRCKGISHGKAHLALWRSFAWTEQGSPKANVRLTYALFEKSKKLLLEELSNLHVNDDWT